MKRIEPVQDFAAKLKVTALVLGCSTQKELAAVFRAANPNTSFDLSRSYKWIQGRALPRSATLYAEWAALLDTALSPRVLATCPLETFCAEVARRHGRDEAELLDHAREGGQALAAPPLGPDDYLCGSYALYSLAQSPHYAGRVLRGSLAITPQGQDGLVGTVAQRFAGLRAMATGAAHAMAHGFAIHLLSPGGHYAPSMLSFFRPTPPASVLVGLFSSFVAMQPGAQPPYAARIVGIRLPAEMAAEVEASNRYLETGESIASDLGALGLPLAASPGLPGLIVEWLNARAERPGGEQLAAEDHARLAAAADTVWLAAAEEAQATAG
jgi:hypothetical protein